MQLLHGEERLEIYGERKNKKTEFSLEHKCISGVMMMNLMLFLFDSECISVN